MATTSDLDRPNQASAALYDCRSRVAQVLTYLDTVGDVSSDDLIGKVGATSCAAGHSLRYAALSDQLVDVRDGRCRLSRRGQEWLDRFGRPSPDWPASISKGAAPLRSWQVEALEAWCEHGRHGVIEAVTGTGKSRVGIEATREALSDDFSVIIAVPTRDLVDQWVASLRTAAVPGVFVVEDGLVPTLDRHRVVVGTIQALHRRPPVRDDGKVLLVADECHRFGAGQWSRLLEKSYERRLGLTATFERNDEGLGRLLDYFGGSPAFRIGFDRAIADGVVAPYGVELIGVELNPAERKEYDVAHRAVVGCRTKLIAADFPAEPFGLFLQRVSEAAEDRLHDEDPTVVDVARRYLKFFTARIEVLSAAQQKIEAATALAPRIASSGGTLLFTRTIAAAEDIAVALAEEGVACEAVHSHVSTKDRRARLAALKRGRLTALVAPSVLDEGVDVPDVDLGVVLGGSKSRRQMIQRMGRVLRLKSDGRPALFIVVFAKNTIEDLIEEDGQEGCLDLILASANSVKEPDGAPATREVVRSSPKPAQLEMPYPDAPAAAEPDRSLPSEIADETPNEPRDRHGRMPANILLADSDLASVSVTRAVVSAFQKVHGETDDATAINQLKVTLQELSRVGVAEVRANGQVTVSSSGIALGFLPDRMVTYANRRDDARTWSEVRALRAASAANRGPQAWVDLPWPSAAADSARVMKRVKELGPLADLPLHRSVPEDHRRRHGGSEGNAEGALHRLLVDLAVDRDRCWLGPDGSVRLARSGYSVIIDKAGAVIGYESGGQLRSYPDYIDFGRLGRNARAICGDEPDIDSPLVLETPTELLDFVDISSVHVAKSVLSRMGATVDRDSRNDYDIDRAIRATIVAEVRSADRLVTLEDGRHLVPIQPDHVWSFRADGLSVSRRGAGLLRSLDRDRSVATLDLATPVSGDSSLDNPQSGRDGVSSPPLESVGRPSVIEQLERLVELKREGYLSDAEFAAAKAKVLA